MDRDAPLHRPRHPRQKPPHQDHQPERERPGGDHHRHHRIKSNQDHAETGSNTTSADVTAAAAHRHKACGAGWQPYGGTGRTLLGPRLHGCVDRWLTDWARSDHTHICPAVAVPSPWRRHSARAPTTTPEFWSPRRPYRAHGSVTFLDVPFSNSTSYVY